MISQAQIKRSKTRFREFSNPDGLVARISEATKTNSGRPLNDPLSVTKMFLESHAEMSAALSEAAQSFGAKLKKTASS